MDGISFLDASIFYSLLFSPLLTMLLLFFWLSTNLRNLAKAQLVGIVVLIILGFLAINSPFITLIEGVALVLLIVWILTNKDSFLKGQLSFISLVFTLQIIYYVLFFIFLGLELNLAFAFLSIIPILSIILLYSRMFGSKKTANGRVFLLTTFAVQVIFAISNLALSLIADY